MTIKLYKLEVMPNKPQQGSFYPGHLEPFYLIHYEELISAFGNIKKGRKRKLVHKSQDGKCKLGPELLVRVLTTNLFRAFMI